MDQTGARAVSQARSTWNIIKISAREAELARPSPLRRALFGFWEAQYCNTNSVFRVQEALSGILGFWVSGVTSQ